jgi:peptide-N4-(N-acetyl-beta-glucosaminyl)asparagine amidase
VTPRPVESDAQARAAMESRLRSGFDTSRAHADSAKQAAARGVVPWDELREAARGKQREVRERKRNVQRRLRSERATDAPADEPADGAADGAADADAELDERGELMMRELLGWFKHSFFSWVDRPECEVTQQPTEPIGMGVPTSEERAGGAGRVELFRGPTGHITRFPRYNDPAVLLTSRKGRCGEWANCFGLIASALGWETRWVLDVTDHVWCEVWMADQQR